MIAYYFIQFQKYTIEEFSFEYLVLLILLIKIINKIGNSFVKVENLKPDQKFCNTHAVEVIPEVLNVFIAEMFPNVFKNFVQKHELNMQFFGYTEE